MELSASEKINEYSKRLLNNHPIAFWQIITTERYAFVLHCIAVGFDIDNVTNYKFAMDRDELINALYMALTRGYHR
jgi:hypothetical protein